jgi:hypothetical protein
METKKKSSSNSVMGFFDGVAKGVSSLFSSNSKPIQNK